MLKNNNEAFRGFQHQDAHEFMNYLLNQIGEELGKEASDAAGACHIPLRHVLFSSPPNFLSPRRKHTHTHTFFSIGKRCHVPQRFACEKFFSRYGMSMSAYVER